MQDMGVSIRAADVNTCVADVCVGPTALPVLHMRPYTASCCMHIQSERIGAQTTPVVVPACTVCVHIVLLRVVAKAVRARFGIPTQRNRISLVDACRLDGCDMTAGSQPWLCAYSTASAHRMRPAAVADCQTVLL